MSAMYIWHIYMYIIFIKKKDVAILCKIKHSYLKIILNEWEWHINFISFFSSFHGIVPVDDALNFLILDWSVAFHVVVRLCYPGLKPDGGIKLIDDVRGHFPPWKKFPSKVTQNLWIHNINMFRICIFCDIKKKRNFTYSQGPHLGLDYIFQCYKQLEEEGRCQHTGLETSDCHGAYVRLNLKFKNSWWYKRHDIKNYHTSITLYERSISFGAIKN